MATVTAARTTKRASPEEFVFKRGREVRGNPMILVESGLLFIINWTILHPVGLALSIMKQPDGSTTIELLDKRHNPDFHFTPAQLADGRTKIKTFMKGLGQTIMQQRVKLLGYHVQRQQAA